MTELLMRKRVEYLLELLKTYDGKSINVPGEEFDWKNYPERIALVSVDTYLFRDSKNYEAFKVIQSLFLRGYLFASFDYFAPIYYYRETIPYMKHLNEMLEMDFMTVDSQPGHNDDINDINNNLLAKYHKFHYGFGYIAGVLHNKYLVDLKWLNDVDILLLVNERELFRKGERIMKVDYPKDICIGAIGENNKPTDYNDVLWIEEEDIENLDKVSMSMLDLSIVNINEDIKQIIKENFTYVEFIHPYIGNNGIFDIVLNALRKFNDINK